MGKPRDPEYFRKYRAAHPDYAARDRARNRVRKATRVRGDRSAEYAKRRRVLLPETLAPPTELTVRREIVLLEDLAQELVLAKLERRRNPQRLVDEYRRREFMFIAITRDLTMYQTGEDRD